MNKFTVISFLVANIFSYSAFSQENIGITVEQQKDILDLTKKITNKDELLISAYRDLLATANALKHRELSATVGLGNNNLPWDPNAIVGGEPTTVDTDPRTVRNFIHHNDRRIWIGMGTVQQGEDLFPDAVAVMTNLNGICTGTLINNNTVITAAHCFCDGHVPQAVVFGLSVAALDRKVMNVDQTRSMTMMKCGDDFKDGDVGIVRLKEDTNLFPRPIAIANAINQAVTGRVVGFGRTETGVGGAKLMADIPITSHQCDGKTAEGINDSDAFGCYKPLELVAASPLYKDSCSGDSGGGLFVQTSSGSYAVAALVSRAVKIKTQPCGQGGIYVRLDGAVLSWLQRNSIIVTTVQ